MGKQNAVTKAKKQKDLVTIGLIATAVAIGVVALVLTLVFVLGGKDKSTDDPLNDAPGISQEFDSDDSTNLPSDSIGNLFD